MSPPTSRTALALVTLFALGGAVPIAGCAGTSASTVAKVGEAERTRATLAGRDVPTLAPQAFAEAEQALRAAKVADRAGDHVAAELEAERAIAAYQHAIALARLTHATDEETQAKEALARHAEHAERHAMARTIAEREADDIEKQLRVAREAERPANAGPADPERERARLVAAQSLATQARLLCSAARLVSVQAPGLAEAETAIADLDQKLETAPRPAPIDVAARARAACLEALTKARRSGATERDGADALLGELSRATDPKATRTTDLSPSRDERGVVVMLRSLFPSRTSEKPSTEGENTLRDLGRIAAAHPDFALQVVIHDASAPTADDRARDTKRGEAVTKALIEGGATSAKTTVEHAGARAPLFDPADTKRREKNARVEIVFVGGR